MSNSDICNCSAFKITHVAGFGKCDAIGGEELLCAECRKVVTTPKLINVGIGAYEYHGAACFDEQLEWVSDCCGESLVSNDPIPLTNESKPLENIMAKCLKTGLDVVLVTHQHEKHRCDLYVTKDGSTLMMNNITHDRGDPLDENEDITCADLVVNCDDFSLVRGVLVVPANDCLIGDNLAEFLKKWAPDFELGLFGRIA